MVAQDHAMAKKASSIWSFIGMAVLLAPLVIVVGGAVAALCIVLVAAPLTAAIIYVGQGRLLLAVGCLSFWVFELWLIRKPWHWLFRGMPHVGL